METNHLTTKIVERGGQTFLASENFLDNFGGDAETEVRNAIRDFCNKIINGADIQIGTKHLLKHGIEGHHWLEVSRIHNWTYYLKINGVRSEIQTVGVSVRVGDDANGKFYPSEISYLMLPPDEAAILRHDEHQKSYYKLKAI